MDIFENKNHRGLIYNGQKPVRILQDPDERPDRSYGGMNRDWYERIDVQNLPNRDGGK